MKTLIGRRILITPLAPVEKTIGGIFIPGNLKEQRNIAVVKKVGTLVDVSLIGKQVMFNLMAAKDFNYENNNDKMIFVSDLVSILN